MRYGSNEANLVVYGSDSVIIDTYVVTVVGLVIPEGRYFGYFEDVLSYAYVAMQNSSNSAIQTNTNTSLEYLILNVNGYNRLSTSQFSIDIQNSLPSLVSGTSLPVFYSMTGIAVNNYLMQFSHSFNATTNTVDLTNC